jgi:D-alanyl-D-alanine-carboxypeptidase/D-alanyl-D-alanine-endopeptidase
MKKSRSNWFWVLLSLGGAVALIVVAAVGFVLWAYLDLRRVQQQADTRDLRVRTQKLAEVYLTKRPKGALVIGVVQGGRTYWLGFGQISATTTNAPGADTIFEIGSVTKVFTGIALAQLVNDGKLRLDDTLAELLPAEVTLPEELRPITLGELATHTAGLPRLPANLDLAKVNAANPYVGYTSRELYEYLRTARLDQPPGKKSAYSNLGVGLLGHLLELRAGVPYEQLVRERILDPLGLTNTAITLSVAQQGRLTPGHDLKGNVVSNWDFAVLAPAGALRSCADDLLKFVQANLATNQPGLGPALALAQKPQYESWTGKLGLCWQILDAPGVYRIHWHNGGTGGYASFVAFDQPHQTGVVLLSNYGDAMAGDNSLDEMGMKLLKLAAKVSWE